MSVGVINTRKELIDGGHKTHPAQNGQGGQTPGKGGVPGHIVSQAKLGNQADGVMRFGDTGIQNTVGELPGANGAQFIGELIQDPHPNPQRRPFTRFSVMVNNSCADAVSNHISNRPF